MKLASVNNISGCLRNISTEKIANLLLPTLINTYGDSTAQYKAGAADAMCHMSICLGKEVTSSKIIPVLDEMLKEDFHDLKLTVVEGAKKVLMIMEKDAFTSCSGFYERLTETTKDNNWRV